MIAEAKERGDVSNNIHKNKSSRYARNIVEIQAGNHKGKRNVNIVAQEGECMYRRGLAYGTASCHLR